MCPSTPSRSAPSKDDTRSFIRTVSGGQVAARPMIKVKD